MSDSMSSTGGELHVRDGKGKFTRTLDSVQRDAEACTLRAQGFTYARISKELGYGTSSNARRAVERVLLETIQEPGDQLRALLLLRHEEIYVLARDIALQEHIAHSGGKIVYHDEEPMRDNGPVLAALDRMMKSLGYIAKLTGANAPQKFEGLSLEMVQAEIKRLESELVLEGGQ